MRSIIREASTSWRCKDVYVGCSGNFTIERIIADLGFRVHSNDVTLYSSAIGNYLSGQPIGVSINEAYGDKWGWLSEYMVSPAGMLSIVLIGSQMFMGDGASSNRYYSRLYDGYLKQWDSMYSKTVEKVESATPFLASYHAGDVVEWVKTLPRESSFICFPPFYAGDYESMFKRLGKVVSWDEPEYEMLDDDRLQVLFQQAQEFDHWMVGNNVRRPEFEAALCGVVRTTNRGVPIYIYSNAPVCRVVSPCQPLESLLVPYLGPDDTLGDEMTVHPLAYGQFASLRSSYMNHNIIPGQGQVSLAFAVGGKVIGACAWLIDRAASRGSTQGHHSLYLLSDFPVAPTQYPRLAKLVLYGALSHESRLITEQYANKRFRYVATTAFTARPVSMKYRGLFVLVSRKELGDGGGEGLSPAEQYYQTGYQLQYRSPYGRWSLQEGLEEWKKKHGKSS